MKRGSTSQALRTTQKLNKAMPECSTAAWGADVRYCGRLAPGGCINSGSLVSALERVGIVNELVSAHRSYPLSVSDTGNGRTSRLIIKTYRCVGASDLLVVTRSQSVPN
jgi:hypothetical protein